jgi:hypothetical protein
MPMPIKVMCAICGACAMVAVIALTFAAVKSILGA